MKLLMLLLLSITLYSCQSQYDVKIKNGAIIRADEYYGRRYKSGDTVCIKKFGTLNWNITNDGNMLDTSYIYFQTSEKLSYLVEYHIGIIK